MYLHRTSQNNRYIGGSFPSIRIQSPIPMEQVSCSDFRLLVVTKACRLGHNNYYFTIFINEVQYKSKYYTDGYISVQGIDLDLGQLRITVKLYYGNGLVYEDCVTAILYHPDIDYKEEPCDPIIEKAEACDPTNEEELVPNPMILVIEGTQEPCDPYESMCESEDNDDGPDNVGPCDPYESMCESKDKEPCDPYESVCESESHIDENDYPCDPYESMECDEDKVVVIQGPRGIPGPRGPGGPRGPKGDGGMIKKVYKSKCLSSKVRTYIVKNSDYKEIVLTLPDAYSRVDDQCKNVGHVVTIYNDSCKQTLVQPPCDYKLKDVCGFFLLNPAQSATFHNLKKDWYVVSK